MSRQHEVTRAPATRASGALRLLGGTALLIGFSLLFAGPEAVRGVAQVCRSLLSV